MSDIVQLKWKSAAEECRIHILRLQVAVSHISRYIPLDVLGVDKLTDEDIAWFDQFLYRFAKLQDTVGDRIFINGLLLLGEDFRDKPFIDTLNRLESLDMIPSYLWWMELREYRNQVAHEYPDRQAEQSFAINEIYGKCDEFIQVVDNFIGIVEARI